MVSSAGVQFPLDRRDISMTWVQGKGKMGRLKTKGNFRRLPHLVGAVYVISDGANLAKVGWSKAPHKRMTDIQTAHGAILYLEYVCYVENARAVERAAHVILRPKRRKGEWFFCKATDAIEAIESVVAGCPHEVTVDIRVLCDSIREASRREKIDRRKAPW